MVSKRFIWDLELSNVISNNQQTIWFPLKPNYHRHTHDPPHRYMHCKKSKIIPYTNIFRHIKSIRHGMMK